MLLRRLAVSLFLLGASGAASAPNPFAAFVKAELNRWTWLLKEMGIQGQ
jgi:hypothetical protein